MDPEARDFALSPEVTTAREDASILPRNLRQALVRQQGWRERCVAARANGGKFTRLDRMLAAEWTTCAVGEQQMKMPEVRIVEVGLKLRPPDETLRNLGALSDTGFTGCVFNDDVDGAERALDLIEDRVMVLKREGIGRTRRAPSRAARIAYLTDPASWFGPRNSA